tara:strand:- start:147 stop:2804 length:2658 start_codon:yes stop_codon:yes gene_type:complete
MSQVTIEVLDYVYESNEINWNTSILGTLDVTSHSEFPLALTFTIADIKDISARKGTFSKTFKIPATKNNNLIYKNVYIANSYSSVNVFTKKDCRILVDNIFAVNGLLQLNAIGGSDNPEYYSCVFFGNNIGWANKIDEKLLKDLGTDGSGWDLLNGKTGTGLEINKTSIISTFNQDDATGASPVVYPVTSYGDFNPSGEAQTLQLLDTAYDAGQTGTTVTSVGYVGSVTNANRYNTPEPVVDWRPCIWVYDVFKEIFIQAGYTVSSNFIEGSIFKKLLFALPNFKYNDDGTRYTQNSIESSFKNSAFVKTFSYTGSGAGTFKQNFFLNLNHTPANFEIDPDFNTAGFTSGSGAYLVPEFGYYNINLLRMGYIYKNFVWNNTQRVTILQSTLRIIVKTVGENHWRILAQTSSSPEAVITESLVNTHTGRGYFGNEINDDTRYFLNKGDIVRTQIHVKWKQLPLVGGSYSTSWDLELYGSQEIVVATPVDNVPNGRYDIKFQPEYAAYGQTYNLKEVINKEYKQIDFIKGVSHAFNLQFTTDEDSKKVYIEPFNDFYKPLGDAIDWTDKVDRSKDYVDKWIKSSLNRELVFKYKSDNKDAKVKQRGLDYFKEIEDEYPYWETLSDKFEKGTSTFENQFFAGTFNAGDVDISTNPNPQPYIACVWEELQDGGYISPNDFARPDKGYEFLPRLLYWKKYSPDLSSNAFAICLKYAVVQTWDTITSAISADQNADLLPVANNVSKVFPQATSVNRDDSSSPILTFGNVWVRDYDDAQNTYTAYSIGSGLYETYYKSMIEMIKENPRIRDVYINLKIKDIINLDLRKLVYIDGVYWRINKINDYSPLNNETTKVELVKWIFYGGFEKYTPRINKNDGNWNNSTGQHITRGI